jgi:hypothetical protein
MGNKKALAPGGTGLAHSLRVEKARLTKYSGENEHVLTVPDPSS